MSRHADTDGPIEPRDETFLQRFSRRKVEAREQPRREDAAGAIDPGLPQQLPQASQRDLLTDADMPDLASLDGESDYSGFLSEKVSETLRRAALRKLFHSAAYNVIDELDDYNEDFTAFEGLGKVVTAEMRYRADKERLREEDKLARSGAETDEAAATTRDDGDGSGHDDPETRITRAQAAEEPGHIESSAGDDEGSNDRHASRTRPVA